MASPVFYHMFGDVMEHKIEGKKLKIRVTNEDISDISWPLAYHIWMRFMEHHPDLVQEVKSYSIELRGDIILVITDSYDPAEIVGG